MMCISTFSKQLSLEQSRRRDNLSNIYTVSRGNTTRRPCCRWELPRDVGHLYRKLASNP